MEIIIKADPTRNYHPGIGVDGQYKPNRKKFEVYEPDPANPNVDRIRYSTDHDKELLVETRKTVDMGAPPVIVTVDHYLKNKDRDGMRVIRELPIKNIREAGWKKSRSTFTMSIPDGIYALEPEAQQAKAVNTEIEPRIEPDKSTSPGRPKKV